jgi:hypothetical protein
MVYCNLWACFHASQVYAFFRSKYSVVAPGITRQTVRLLRLKCMVAVSPFWMMVSALEPD